MTTYKISKEHKTHHYHIFANQIFLMVGQSQVTSQLISQIELQRNVQEMLTMAKCSVSNKRC